MTSDGGASSAKVKTSESTKSTRTSKDMALTPPQKVTADLEAAANIATANDEVWSEALQSSLAWILSIQQSSELPVASSSKAAAASDLVHWYCGKNGAQACWRSSVFLIRLLSFKKRGEVLDWCNALQRLLDSCCDCALQFEAAKNEFVEKFLKLRFHDRAIESFLEGVNAYELDHVANAISKAASLTSLDPGILTRILSSTSLIQDQRIAKALRGEPKVIKDSRLPDGALPGHYVLAVHTDEQVRVCVFEKLRQSPPLALADFDRFRIATIIDAHLQLSVDRDQGRIDAPSRLAIDYTAERKPFWRGIGEIVQNLGSQALTKRLSRRDNLDIVQIIASHLSDNGDHFDEVLSAFAALLVKLRTSIWSSSDEEFQELVLHSILDNGTFEELLTSDESPTIESQYLTWVRPFLQSVSLDADSFAKALSIIMSALLSRYQQPRFSIPTRAAVIEIAFALLADILGDDAQSNAGSSDPQLNATISVWPCSDAALRVLDMYSDTITQTAFGKQSKAPEWQSASKSAMEFLAFVWLRENKRLTAYVLRLASYGLQAQASAKEKDKGVPDPPPVFATASGLWKQLDTAAPKSDVHVVAALLEGLVCSAHLEKLTSRSWSFKSLVRSQMRSANDALELLRVTPLNLLHELADERQDLLIPFMSEPNVIANITTLLLSPVEQVYNVSQRLLRQTFDEATSRRDIFRSLLAESPDQVTAGLSAGLRAFREAARVLPETCGMAKRLVRCLSDVLDVLCATHDGLFRDQNFFKRSEDEGLRGRLLTLWKRMCESLGVLFKRTPAWAAFFENEQMTEWMRDAILFGVDLLNQARSFESAVLGQSLDQPQPVSPSRVKVSKTGQRMVYALNDPLEELVAWLRLNDEDLLASSFDLLCSMLERFARTGVAVRESTIAKLRKFTAKRSKDGASRSSILRDDQLQALLESLDQFENDSKPLPDKDRRSVASGSTKSSSTADQKNAWAQLLDGQQPSPKSNASKRQAEVIISAKATAGETTKKPNLAPSITESLGKLRPVVEIKQAASSKSSLPTQKLSKPPNFGVKPMQPTRARPRGVPWTTYSSSKPLTSSSEDDSSDGEDAKEGDKKKSGLAMLAQAQKPTIRQDTEKRQVKLLDDSTNRSFAGPRGVARGSAIRQQQALSARLRGQQDVSELHRHVLQWNPLEKSDLPPTLNDGFRSLASAFRTSGEYISMFEPLLLIECWDQIKQSMQELDDSTKFKVVIAGRADVDDFVDVDGTIEHSDIPDRAFLTESDLVILRQGSKQTLAKVQAYVRKREFIEVKLRCHFGRDTSDVSGALSGRTKWELVQLYTLSTVHREFAALHSLPFLTLLPDILSSSPKAAYKPDRTEVANAVQKYGVNEPQATAILSTLKTPGFSLIQGPPGTGKTKTILGLVGAFLDDRARTMKPSNPSLFNGNGSGAESPAVTRKLLVCAPSNAAVDEVARRIKGGIRRADGQIVTPKVVRIGAEAAIDVAVKDIYIDELVAAELGGVQAADVDQAALQKIRLEVTQLRLDRDAKKEELANHERHEPKWQELDGELRKINARINDLSDKLDSERDRAQQSRRAADASQRRVRLNILNTADVICSTLSGAGHDYLSQLPFDFETVIIDEAAQSVELSSLIPLKYGCRQCIMVGDPLQLPPTVISRIAMRNNYDRSLFVRMMESNPASVHLLSIQYRMHPSISSYPSQAFYQGRLKDGPEMAKITRQPWHAKPIFPPYAFMHVKGGNEVKSRHHSLSNPEEAKTALAIYERLLGDFGDIDFAQRVGIITPYKGQVHELRRVFRARLGYDITQRITFNTVDGFQGQEKDVIILSCVRGGSTESTIGFLSDTRRMNVALTRARSSLFILGDQTKLRSNQFWRELVEDAEKRSVLFEVDADAIRKGTVATASSSSRSASPMISKNGAPATPSHAAGGENGKKRDADAIRPAHSAHKEAIIKKIKTEAVPIALSARKATNEDKMDVDEEAKDVKPDVSRNAQSAAAPRPVAQAAQQAFRPRPKAPPSLFIKSKRPGQK